MQHYYLYYEKNNQKVIIHSNDQTMAELQPEVWSLIKQNKKLIKANETINYKNDLKNYTKH